MADAAVVFALGKLANIIMKEMEFLGGVGKKVKQVESELTRIRCCLIDADSKRNGDARVQNWLNELRDVAYRIEDAIDMFILQNEDNYHKNPCHENPSFLQKIIKKLRTKPPKIYILNNLGTELDNIQKELKGISKSRTDYGIIALEDIVGETVMMPVRRAAHQEVDETEVVGLQADNNKILKLLRPEETLRRAVITIVGTGGIGKTTLARMVYRSARANFEYHKMLSISETFTLTDLLTKMLLKDSVQENKDVGDLINELKSFLCTRRYLIILDDVWTVDLWNQLKDAMPDVKNGSRVLMTSRSIDVATSAESKIAPYELRFLDDRKSLDLLLKKALPYQEPNEECPSDLLEFADKLSKKCKGLPLALIVLGGILSTRKLNYHVWERVLRTMDWHSEGRDCMDVLALSYQDMPYYLKACFLYLASFPKDYEISAKHLIRMWVAEGFIPHEGRKTLEETAENYLEQLFRRCMVQVSRRSIYGSINSCIVHDLLCDLAMHEARQENFVTVFSPESDVNQPNRGTRRFSLQHSLEIEHTSQPSMEYVGPNTRSILMFYSAMPLLNFSNFRLLKVLVLEFNKAVIDDLSGFDELVNLKYLAIKACKFPPKKKPFCFCRMKALETINILNFSWAHFCYDTLWTIGTLRHVRFSCIDGPPSTADLKNLQTLKTVRTLKTWNRKLPFLNNLRKLGLVVSCDWVTVSNLLQVLPFLVSLTICIGYVRNIPMEIVYPKALPNYQNLQSLFLDGEWSQNVTLEASSFPPHLVTLKLHSTKFKQNPMPELGKLKNLKKLCFIRWCFAYDSPTIFPAGFPVLQYLKLTGSSYNNDFTVAEGVMPKLTYVLCSGQVNFHLPPELQHVTIDHWGRNVGCTNGK